MALFWIVHDVDGARVVRIEESHALIFARFKAVIDGFGGKYVEGHEFDAKLAEKIPRKMIGRVLTADEATALLLKLKL